MKQYIVECSTQNKIREITFYEKNKPISCYNPQNLENAPWSENIKAELKMQGKLFEMRIKKGLDKKISLVTKVTLDD